jgi:hypothetical protein
MVTGLVTFYALSKISDVSSRTRFLWALVSAFFIATQIIYHSALENSVSFNRLM